MVHTAITLTLLGVGLGLGCSSGSSGGSGNPAAASPIDLSQYCESKANAYCGIIVPCCSQAGFSVEQSKCHDAAIAACQSEITSNQSKGRTYNAKNAGVCLAGVSTTVAGCKEVSSSTDPNVKIVNDACSRIWGGSVPIGGACSTSNDCAIPADGSKVNCTYTSSPDGGTSTGTCKLSTVAKVGETCGFVQGDAGSSSYISCDTGLYCQTTTGDGGVSVSVCAAPAGAGADCTSSSGCTKGLTCDATTKKCASPAALGGACTPYDSTSCTTGNYCDSTTRKCVALPGAGFPCITTQSPQCQADAYCDQTSKNCVAKKASGQTCTSSSECISAYCGSTSTTTTRVCATDPGIASASLCNAVESGTLPTN